MESPYGAMDSSPDPLTGSAEPSIALSASSALRRTARSQRRPSYFDLEARSSARRASISPRKQVFRLDVGDTTSPKRLRVTVETENEEEEDELEASKMGANVNRRLFSNHKASIRRHRPRSSSIIAPSSPIKSAKKIVATTTMVPLRGLSDDEDGDTTLMSTPKRPRGRPRRSGTPLPRHVLSRKGTASPDLSTPAVEKSPRRGRRPKSATPGQTSSVKKASPRKTTPKPSAPIVPSSDIGSIADSRPRKRGRPRRQAMAPDEMAALSEQQQEIDPATHFYASVEDDEPPEEHTPIQDDAGLSPALTALSSVDLIKVQTPLQELQNGANADANRNSPLSPVLEVSGIEHDVSAIRNDSPERHSHDEADEGDEGDGGNEDVGFYGGNEMSPAYDYNENEHDDYAPEEYVQEEYESAPVESAEHDRENEEAEDQDEDQVEVVEEQAEEQAEETRNQVEDRDEDQDELGDPPIPPAPTIPETSRIDNAPSSGGPTPTRQRLQARFTHPEPTPSESDGDVDTVSASAAYESDEESAYSARPGSGATTNLRDQDTIAKGEDFSMIGMESLQTSINMSYSELPAMGETTSRIVSRTLEAIRHGNEEDEGDSALQMLEIIQQSDETTPRAAAPSPRPTPYSKPTPTAPPSSKSRSAKKAEPLNKVLARKSLFGPPVEVQAQHENNEYDDSFSEIPDSVLEAVVPETTNTEYFSQQQAELTGRVFQSRQALDSNSRRPVLVDKDRRQPENVERRNSSPQTAIENARIEYSNEWPVHGDTNNGDEEEQEEAEMPEMAEMPAADLEITSSPPPGAIESRHHPLPAETSFRSESFFQEAVARSTPVILSSPRPPPKAPFITNSERPERPDRPDRLAIPSEGFRPSLSPIVRAGRALQSVTSDPPSPKEVERVLRSPFRRSVPRDTNSPAVVPPNEPNPADSQPASQTSSVQTVNRTPVQMADRQRRVETTSVQTAQPVTSASRPMWATALAPFSGLKNLVVGGAQIVSPRLQASPSPAPVAQSPATPNAAPIAQTPRVSPPKRSSEAAQLDADIPVASPQSKRPRLAASSGAESGAGTGRSWRSVGFGQGSIAGSISNFASKLVSRNPTTEEAETNRAEMSMIETSTDRANVVNSLMNRDANRGNTLSPHENETAAPDEEEPEDNDNYDEEEDEEEDEDDLDIWAIEAARPTPAPISRTVVPPKKPEAAVPMRDPRLVRLAAEQMKKSVMKSSVLQSNMFRSSTMQRLSQQPAEDEEEDYEEFSLLDTQGDGAVDVQRPPHEPKRPAPFNLDDFFSSPVAVPKMLPPTSEKNIQFNEKSRMETLERLLEHETRRDSQNQKGPSEGSEKATASQPAAAIESSAMVKAKPATQSPVGSFGSDKEPSRFGVSVYGQRPVSMTPPRLVGGGGTAAAGARRGTINPPHNDEEVADDSDDSNRRYERLLQPRQQPRRRRLSNSQQFRANILRVMGTSSDSGSESEDPLQGETPTRKTAEAVVRPVVSTPTRPARRPVPELVEPASLEVPEEDNEEEDEEVHHPSQGSAEDADESMQSEGHGEEEEPSGMTYEESSFLTPDLKPLPAKTASPTKSCLRPPTKPKTPGRVVEFTNSTLANEDDSTVQIQEERESLQNAALRFAEHFALDTANRVRTRLLGGGNQEQQQTEQTVNPDGDISMTDMQGEDNQENSINSTSTSTSTNTSTSSSSSSNNSNNSNSSTDSRRRQRGYEVDEELSAIMLSDAHEISQPLQPVAAPPRYETGQPQIISADIQEASWQSPPVADKQQKPQQQQQHQQRRRPVREWTLEDWLSLNDIVQEYRQLGPEVFREQYGQAPPTERSLFGRTSQRRPAQALQHKVVHTQREGMLVKDWHLDIVEAFYNRAGRVWSYSYLLRRLFSLFIGEARHGILEMESPERADRTDRTERW